ncbi:MAG: hypothetical protein HY231_06650 [Acidobacteria bacterium]|nr:hypothetical protein [Acidobacteriota bacterium]
MAFVEWDKQTDSKSRYSEIQDFISRAPTKVKKPSTRLFTQASRIDLEGRKGFAVVAERCWGGAAKMKKVS